MSEESKLHGYKLNAPFGYTTRRMKSATYLILFYCSLLLSLVLFISCGSQAGSPSTTINPDVKAITDILSTYCNAVTNHDTQKIGEFVRGYLGQHYTPQLYAQLMFIVQSGYKNVTGCTVGPVSLSADGQTATGRVSYMQANGEVLNVDYKLTKYNGVWTLTVR